MFLEHYGFRIESSFIGDVEGKVVFVPYNHEFNWSTNLGARYDEWMTMGFYLIACAEQFPGAVVRDPGRPCLPDVVEAPQDPIDMGKVAENRILQLFAIHDLVKRLRRSRLGISRK